MVRNGLRGRKQLYLREAVFRWLAPQVITDYVEGKQTLDQLALKYGVNEKTHPDELPI